MDINPWCFSYLKNYTIIYHMNMDAKDAIMNFAHSLCHWIQGCFICLVFLAKNEQGRAKNWSIAIQLYHSEAYTQRTSYHCTKILNYPCSSLQNHKRHKIQIKQVSIIHWVNDGNMVHLHNWEIIVHKNKKEFQRRNLKLLTKLNDCLQGYL